MDSTDISFSWRVFIGSDLGFSDCLHLKLWHHVCQDMASICDHGKFSNTEKKGNSTNYAINNIFALVIQYTDHLYMNVHVCVHLEHATLGGSIVWAFALSAGVVGSWPGYTNERIISTDPVLYTDHVNETEGSCRKRVLFIRICLCLSYMCWKGHLKHDHCHSLVVRTSAQWLAGTVTKSSVGRNLDL